MGTGPYMSHEINLLGFWFITAWHGGKEAGSNVFTCCDILGPFLGILDKNVWRWASLTLVFPPAIQHAYEVFNLQWTESSSSSISLRHVKHLDDPLHSLSPGKAFSFLSDWMLLYNHNQCVRGRQPNLEHLEEKGGCCSYQQPLVDYEPHYSKYLTHLPAHWYLCIFSCSCHEHRVPWQHHIGDGHGEKVERRHQHHLHKPGPEWDVFVNLAASASQNTSQVMVCAHDAEFFIVFLHHAHHLGEVVMKLGVRAGTTRDAWI